MTNLFRNSESKTYSSETKETINDTRSQSTHKPNNSSVTVLHYLSCNKKTSEHKTTEDNNCICLERKTKGPTFLNLFFNIFRSKKLNSDDKICDNCNKSTSTTNRSDQSNENILGKEMTCSPELKSINEICSETFCSHGDTCQNRSIENLEKQKESKLYEKEFGLKFDFLWVLKCPKCLKRHRCHCITNKPPKKCVKRIKSDSGSLLVITPEDPVTGCQEIDKEAEEAEKRNKKLNDEMDEIDNKLDVLKKLLGCLENYEPPVQYPDLSCCDKYRIERSKSNPCILNIKPPLNECFNRCIENKDSECMRIDSGGDTFCIHGDIYQNEDDTLSFYDCVSNLVPVLLDEKENKECDDRRVDETK